MEWLNAHALLISTITTDLAPGVYLGIRLRVERRREERAREAESEPKRDPVRENQCAEISRVLNHQSHPEHRFETIHALFPDNTEEETRKLLWRVNAKPSQRKDGSERWSLASRELERIAWHREREAKPRAPYQPQQS